MPVIHNLLNIMDIVLNGICKLYVRMLMNQRLSDESGCGQLSPACGWLAPPLGFSAGAADDAHNQLPK